MISPDVIRKVLDARQNEQHTCLPGQVLIYNAATMTASIELVVTHPIEDDEGTIVYEDMPPLQDVPIAFPRGGGYGITWPLSPGDSVLVLFAELDIGTWRATGSKANPEGLRKHTLSNGFALPCIGPDASPLLTQSIADALVIQGGSADVWLGADLSALLDNVALNSLVQAFVDTFVVAFNSHTHTGATGPIAGSPVTQPAAEEFASPNVYARKP